MSPTYGTKMLYFKCEKKKAKYSAARLASSFCEQLANFK